MKQLSKNLVFAMGESIQQENQTMKTIQTLILSAVVSTSMSLLAAAPASDPPKADSNAQVAANTATATPPESAQKSNGPLSSETTAPSATSKLSKSSAPPDNDTNTLRMNFHAASLDLVLNHLSEAAGFVVNIKPGTSVKGKVDVWSNDPLTREEALNLLDTVLNQNGLAAIRNGKTITIVNKDEAKTQNIPVIQGNDPDKIPVSDKIVTQIVPVRFVEVAQLVKDLQPLVSSLTTMTANEAGNAIVITDTQANIRKVVEVIHAIDMGAEDFTEVRLFKLANADPTETADMLTNLFPDDSKQGSSGQSPFSTNPFFSRFASRFGGGGGGPGGSSGGGPGGGGNNSNNQNQRIKKRNRVIAVADQRTASVVVSASKDLMEQIAEVVTQLDGDSKGRQMVTVFNPQATDPEELRQVMTDLFNKSGTANNNRNNTSGQNSSALQNRSNTQNQQNNSASRSGSLGSGSRGGVGGGGTSFP
jgi:type II secretory pathway component GspD/PulD (secretin)